MYNIDNYNKYIKKNVYWLYYKSTLKTDARICFLILILFLLMLYILKLIQDPEKDPLLNTFTTLSLAFIGSYLLKYNPHFDTSEDKIDELLSFFYKSVILLDAGKRLLEERVSPHPLKTSPSPYLEYIRDELATLLQTLKDTAYRQPKELEFLTDSLKITLKHFATCVSATEDLQNLKEDLKVLNGEYIRLIAISNYFLSDDYAETYKKYFFYTFKDIKKIRKKCNMINIRQHVEAMQLRNFIKNSR